MLGSCAGLMLGAGYLIAGPRPSAFPGMGAIAQSAAPASETPSAARAVQASAVPAMSPSGGAAGFAASLRRRFGLGPAARPFAFARVAEAPTDLHCLAETVYFEARGESQDGQKAVAQVVLNRVRHPAFPKTICAVVHQRTAGGCQFSFACSSREAAVDSLAWRRAEMVASAALHGAVMAAVGDATHFQSAHAGSFAGLMKVAQVGAHAFYRFAGREGATAMFRQSPLPSAPARIELARLEPTDATATAAPRLVEVKMTTASAAPASGSPAPAASKTSVVAVKLGAFPAAPLGRTAVAPVTAPALPATPLPAVAPTSKAQGPAVAKPAATLALAQS